MSELAALIRRVRRRAKDNPRRALIQNDPLAANGASLTLRANEVGNFKDGGIQLCFDDGTDELVITNAPADTSASTVAIDRGQDGTVAAEHVKNTAALIRPRFSNAEILEQIVSIVDEELFPQVWLAGEASLTYQSANEYYDPGVPDIEEVVYAYQLSGGLRYPVMFDFLPRALADDANFPDGAITLIEPLADTTPVYYAYRARPTLGTLTSTLEGLVVQGSLAALTMAEESAHVGGGTSAVQQRVQDGSRLRAGLVLWERFDAARMQERIRLQSEEQMRRRQVTGVGRVG